jgi:hypothetical protein
MREGKPVGRPGFPRRNPDILLIGHRGRLYQKLTSNDLFIAVINRMDLERKLGTGKKVERFQVDAAAFQHSASAQTATHPDATTSDRTANGEAAGANPAATSSMQWRYDAAYLIVPARKMEPVPGGGQYRETGVPPASAPITALKTGDVAALYMANSPGAEGGNRTRIGFPPREFLQMIDPIVYALPRRIPPGWLPPSADRWFCREWGRIPFLVNSETDGRPLTADG